MASHPDRLFADYIFKGLSEGFRIGFSRGSICLHSRTSNHPSALANQEVVQQRITEEVAAGRLHGPLPQQLASLVHTSPMGLVPKAHQSNKWRLIVDLSHPSGSSINDGIDPELSSVKYSSVDNAVSIIMALGKGAELVKLDIKDAYRIVPVHPSDYHLLGILWEGKKYIDRALPFGLRSAPKIFSAVADLIAWVLNQVGIKCQIHYLDDFLFIGAPGTDQAAQALTIVLETFNTLGIPVAVHKTEGPTTALGFLGILIDTRTFELRLPSDKLARLQEMIRSWSGRRSCTKKELESLLGHLSHAAMVIRQGRTFLRELFPLLHVNRGPTQFIRLNASARADLLWWRIFLKDWNGKSFFPVAAPSVEVVSDASGAYGCGGFSLPHGWFQVEWPENWHSIHIAAKELVPIVIAASIWGPAWRQRCVCFRTDNMSVVNVLGSCTSKDPVLMHLIRCLIFYAALFRFQFVAEHIPGVINVAADAISRNNLPLFHSIVPQIPQAAIPQPVMELLVTNRPDWGSKSWTTLFERSLNGEYQTPQEPHTNLDGGNTAASVPGATSTPSLSQKATSVSSQHPCQNQ